MRVDAFDGDLAGFGKDYSYQQTLTARLDDIGEIEFTQELVNEIVLWKVNRFVHVDVHVLREIAAVKHLHPGEHRQAESVLGSLLNVHGVDLPMASTLLRFRNPAVFQIIDRHAYRAVYGEDFPKTIVAAKKISMYFRYLDELLNLCAQRNLEFKTVDRVLYQFDKKKNGKLKSD